MVGMGKTTGGVIRENKSQLSVIYNTLLPIPLSKESHPHLWKFLFQLMLLIIVTDSLRGRNLVFLGSASLSLRRWNKKARM